MSKLKLFFYLIRIGVNINVLMYILSVVKDVQCYELFGGIALKNHAFSFSYIKIRSVCET